MQETRLKKILAIVLKIKFKLKYQKKLTLEHLLKRSLGIIETKLGKD
jgi:hypothetical protein